jgi:hypothetical protein
MSRKTGYRSLANYNEDLVGFALESFLTFISFPRFRYSIEPFSTKRERWLGADARLHARIAGFAPLYMQFKRPTAYDEQSGSRYIRERKKLKLSVSPHALYFELRDKKPKHHDFQHNVLLKLSSKLRARGLGDAVYVCPLFLDRAAYRWNMHLAAFSHRLRFWDDAPFALHGALINSSTGQIQMDRVPILNEHICIRPHCKVTSAKHAYSFSENGSEVCFHSPVSLPDAGKPLGRWLTGAFTAFRESDAQQRFTVDNALNGLRSLLAGEDPFQIPVHVFETNDGIEAWHRFGAFLQEEHSIEQYAIVEWTSRQQT